MSLWINDLMVQFRQFATPRGGTSSAFSFHKDWLGVTRPSLILVDACCKCTFISLKNSSACFCIPPNGATQNDTKMSPSGAAIASLYFNSLSFCTFCAAYLVS